MKTFQASVLKNGQKVELCFAELEDVENILEFVNRLIIENTFLSFGPNPCTLEEEQRYLENLLKNIESKKCIALFAKKDGKIIGSCDIYRGENKMSHVGNVGIMVDRDFRGQGLGRILLCKILDLAKKQGIEIAKLSAFAINTPALNLYKSVGFEQYGYLPKALQHKGKFEDEVLLYKIV